MPGGLLKVELVIVHKSTALGHQNVGISLFQISNSHQYNGDLNGHTEIQNPKLHSNK